MKRLCIMYLNSDTIIIATARCLQGLNNNSPWFQRSCGEPAAVNNQLVRDKTGLACLGKKSWSKGWTMPWLEEGWTSSARSQKKAHGAAGCCGFEYLGEEEGGIWTGRLWKKSAAGRQDIYCPWKEKVRNVKQVSSTLRLKGATAFTVFLALPPLFSF